MLLPIGSLPRFVKPARHHRGPHQASAKPARSVRPRIHGTTSTGRARCGFVAPGERVRAGRRPVQSHARSGAIRHRWSELRAIRNPMLLLVLNGLLLLRFATRQWFALLFQLPPRVTRFVPDGRRPESFVRGKVELACDLQRGGGWWECGSTRAACAFGRNCGVHDCIYQTTSRKKPVPRGAT